MAILGNAEGTTIRGKINKLYELRGYSTYEIALINGFEGTEEEWLASLKGEKGDKGDAYVMTEENEAEIMAYINELRAELDDLKKTVDDLLYSSFTVHFEDGATTHTYKFETGMTWAQWVASEYNTDNFYDNGFGGYSVSSGAYLYTDSWQSTRVATNDVIIKDNHYYASWN